MSTKPTKRIRWATSNIPGSDPPSGYLDTGYVTGVSPTPAYDNWYQYYNGLWIAWLDDGDVSFNSVAVAGAVTINGNTTIGDASADTLTVNATSTFGAATTFTANTTIGDASADTLTVNATSTVNAKVTLSGTNYIARGNRTRTIDPTLGFNPTAGGSTQPSATTAVYRTGASGGSYSIPIAVENGETIVSINMHVKAASVGAIATAQLYRQVDAVATAIGASWASAGTLSYLDATSAAINHATTSGAIYKLVITFSGTAANTDFERIDLVTAIA